MTYWQYYTKDLFDDLGSHRVIAHGVNCRGAMGAGFARQIRTRFPKAYDRYMMACQRTPNPERLLGRILPVRISEDLTVIHCFTQLNYGRVADHRYLSYDALYDCFKKIGSTIDYPVPIAIPKIGCGLAGGNWEIVEAIITETTTNHLIKVYDVNND